MQTIRSGDGRTWEVRVHRPLRLQLRASIDAASIPGDIVRRILSFLSAYSEDWLSADSCCSVWQEASLPLWNGRRSETISLIRATRRVHRKWEKLKGFLDREVRSSLQAPATDDDIIRLKQTVSPWVLPPEIIASFKIHDGERDRGFGRGMYLGSRLLSVREIRKIFRGWKKENNEHLENGILKLPLFTHSAARQVAIELYHKDNPDYHLNGRIVLIGSFAPFAPHFKVLASSWEGFLTLV